MDLCSLHMYVTSFNDPREYSFLHSLKKLAPNLAMASSEEELHQQIAYTMFCAELFSRVKLVRVFFKCGIYMDIAPSVLSVCVYASVCVSVLLCDAHCVSVCVSVCMCVYCVRVVCGKNYIITCIKKII